MELRFIFFRYFLSRSPPLAAPLSLSRSHSDSQMIFSYSKESCGREESHCFHLSTMIRINNLCIHTNTLCVHMHTCECEQSKDFRNNLSKTIIFYFFAFFHINCPCKFKCKQFTLDSSRAVFLHHICMQKMTFMSRQSQRE